MAWDARQTYYYLVCFATLLMVIIGTVQVVRATLDLALPEEPYRPSVLDLRDRFNRPAEAVGPDVTREELEQMAEEEAERQRQANHRRALRNLLGNLALVLIAAPVYAYHWRQVRQS